VESPFTRTNGLGISGDFTFVGNLSHTFDLSLSNAIKLNVVSRRRGCSDFSGVHIAFSFGDGEQLMSPWREVARALSVWLTWDLFSWEGVF
jgi:hypothetical protein